MHREFVEALTTVDIERLPDRFVAHSGNWTRPAGTHGPRIYYIRFGDRIKIGTTTNLRQRLASLPHDEILAVEPGGVDLERLRHQQFEKHWIKGEWFRAEPELLRHTQMLASHFGVAQPT